MKRKFFARLKMNLANTAKFILFAASFFSATNLFAQEKEVSKSILIHQEIDFNASPEKIYKALLSSKEFSAFSGRTAEINSTVGGRFSLFNKHIIGQNIELVPNQRIVQAWRVVDWPEGIYSIARFEFKSQRQGCRLVFDHIGFPEGLHDHLAEGWQQNYWDLLVKYLK